VGLVLLCSGLACAAPITLSVRVEIIEPLSNPVIVFRGFSTTLVAESAGRSTPGVWEVSSTGDLTNLHAATGTYLSEYVVGGHDDKVAHFAGGLTIYQGSASATAFVTGIDEVGFAFAPTDPGPPCGDVSDVARQEGLAGMAVQTALDRVSDLVVGEIPCRPSVVRVAARLRPHPRPHPLMVRVVVRRRDSVQPMPRVRKAHPSARSQSYRDCDPVEPRHTVTILN